MRWQDKNNSNNCLRLSRRLWNYCPDSERFDFFSPSYMTDELSVREVVQGTFAVFSPLDSVVDSFDQLVDEIPNIITNFKLRHNYVNDANE